MTADHLQLFRGGSVLGGPASLWAGKPQWTASVDRHRKSAFLLAHAKHFASGANARAYPIDSYRAKPRVIWRNQGELAEFCVP
jgi:hypothetical protein